VTARRRIALALVAVMTVVTAWSIWAFAQQPAPPPPAPNQGHLYQPAPGVRPFPRPGSGPGSSGALGGAPGSPRPPGAPRPPGLARPAPPHAKGAEDKSSEAAESAEKPEDPNWIELHKVDKHGEPIPPYVAMLVNFGILIAGYYLLGKKPIAAALQSRRDHIAKDIEEAQRMRKEAEERAKVYQVKLASLEQEVKAAREALVHAGEAERDRLVSEAEAKAERMRRDAEFLVEQELKQIRHDLWKDTVEAAVSAAEDLLKKRVTPADQERLAEDYLADLGGKKEAPAAGAPQESAS
jgi:F-type H+-transporting ATPase subunit b